MATKAKKRTKRSTSRGVLGKIRTRRAHVVVIGQGYVGLPLAREVAEAGMKVTGLEIQADLVRRLNQGKSHIADVPSSTLATMIRKRLYRATADPKVLADADCVCICVPT